MPISSAMICASVVRRPCPCGDEPMRASTKPDGSTVMMTVSQPGVISMPRAAKRRAAVAGALGECREADAEMAALGARLGLTFTEGGHIDRLHRHFQRLLVGRLVIFEAHRRLVGKFVNEVAAADVDRVESESACRLVHQPLEREGDDRPRYAAIGRHRAGIRDHAAGEALVLLHVIRAGHFRHGHQAARPRMSSESTNRRRYWR